MPDVAAWCAADPGPTVKDATWAYRSRLCEAAFHAASRPVHARGLLLVVFWLAAAADGLQLGEHGVDIEVVALFLAGLEFRILAGGLGGRQQGGAAIGGLQRLFLRGALHLEIEFDLRAQAEGHRVHWSQGRGIPVCAVA